MAILDDIGRRSALAYPDDAAITIRMEVASSRPDHLPALSAAETSKLYLLVKSPFGGGAADAGNAAPTLCFTLPAISKLTTLTVFQIGAGLYAVGRPVQKRNDEDGQIGTIQSLPLERGALFNRFFGEPAHGPPHVAGGASGPIGGCRDESRTDNPDLDLRHVFDRNNRKTDLI